MKRKCYENWVHRNWRPALGWAYVAICIFDFIVAPLLWSGLQAVLKVAITQWVPITMTGAGMFHAAMGGVLGVTAWSRGQEKIKQMHLDMQPRERQEE